MNQVRSSQAQYLVVYGPPGRPPAQRKKRFYALAMYLQHAVLGLEQQLMLVHTTFRIPLVDPYKLGTMAG